MPLRRTVLLLAMLAALVMAPSSVFAASPNELRAADVSPVIGLSTHPFAFSIQYHSAADNPAQSVSVSVAGISMPLLLVSGTAIDGTWQATGPLPTGTWTVTFTAQVANGEQPSLTFGEVQVVADSPSASAGSGGGAENPISDPGSGGSSSGQPAPQVTAVPSASTAPAPASHVPRPSTSPAPAASARRAEAVTHQRPRPGRSGAGEKSATPATAPGRSGAPPGRVGASDSSDPPLLWTILFLGGSVVGGVALVGTAWVLLGSRREREAAPAIIPDAVEPDLAQRAISTLEQRAMRRARIRQIDDPILAGLGLDEETTTAESPRRRPGGRPPR
jgi:hypothetical protein